MTLFINCLVVTNDCKFIDVTFPLSFPIDASVSQLAKEIYEKNTSVPRHFDYPDLTLWKPLSHFPADPAGNIPDRVKDMHLGSNDGNCAAQKLRKASRLGLYFANESLSDTQVHVIVQLPKEPYSPADRGKRGREDEYVESGGLTDLRQYFAKSVFINFRPSVVALPSNCQKYQEMEEHRILNDRPSKDVEVTPIALLYQPFGQFLDRMHDYPQEDDGIDLMALELAVDDFASAMSRHHKSEEDRKILAFDLLDRIFSSNKSLVLPPIEVGTISRDWQSDGHGHANGPAHIMETIVQVENELGSGNADPEVQLTAHFTQMHSDHFDCGCHDGLYDRFLFPTLGISIIGRPRRNLCGCSARLTLDHLFQALTSDSVRLSSSTGRDL